MRTARSSIEVLLGSSAALLIAAAGFWFMAARNRPVDANFGLVVEPEALRFGETLAQDDFVHAIEVTNAGSESRKLVGFDTTCVCTRVEPQEMVLAPGKRQAFQVHLNLQGALGRQVDQPVPFSVFLTPRIETPDGVVSGRGWLVEGDVRTVLVLEPSTVTFGGAEALVGEQTAEKLVRISARPDVKDIDVLLPESAVADVRCERAATGSGFVLRVTPRADLAAGVFASQIRLQPQLTTGGSVPPVPFLVSGEKLAAVAVTPTVVNFGLRRQSETARERIQVCSRVGRPFVIRKFLSTDDSVQLTPESAEAATRAAAKHELELEQVFHRVGASQAELELIATSPDATDADVHMRIKLVAVVQGQ